MMISSSPADTDFEHRDWVRLLEARAQSRGSDPAFTFLDRSGEEIDRRTYRELYDRARDIAVHLQSRDGDIGQVVLFYPQGMSFLDGFFGAMFAGGVPVPAFAPDTVRNNVRRLESIVADSGARVILTDSASAELLREWGETSDAIAALRIVETDSIAIGQSDAWQLPDRSWDDVAFLQYTSGSTGTPKGVIVSHGNLLAMTKMLSGFYAVDAESTFVSWVPLYHDLGLIGNVLFSVFNGAHCVMMAPESFVRAPLTWLRAISHYRANISFAPTFAFGFSLRHIAKLDASELDLSCWKTAVIGAEPIYPTTIEMFSKAAAKFGFRREAFQCAYGLAESTLMVVTTPHASGAIITELDAHALERGAAQDVVGSSSRDVRRLVSSGVPGPGHTAAIVDPTTGKECPDGTIGEIWLSGPCICKGYFRNEDATRAMFENFLPGAPHEGPFLRSGDLGFIRDGQLYFTGRAKEIIIVAGANHYPQDIEMTAFSASKLLRPGCAAAFAVQSEDEEAMVIVHEIRDPAADEATIASAMRSIGAAIREAHGLSAHDIVFIPPGTLPKTSSGKIQRTLMRQRYLDGSLDAIARLRATAPVVETAGTTTDATTRAFRNWVQFTLADLVGVELAKIDLGQHVTNLGLNSLKVVSFLAQASDRLGVPEKQLKPWDHDTVDAWIDHVCGATAAQPAKAAS